MRRRDETLRKGHVFLVWLSKGASPANRSLFFAKAGKADMECEQTIRTACEAWAKSAGHANTRWLKVSNIAHSCAVAPDLDPSRTKRLECQEFAGLSQDDTNAILHDGLSRLANDEPEIFPRAGGAVGGVARGIQFLDRDDDVRNICEYVRQGKCLRIVAPRRTGKSSLLCRLNDTLGVDSNMPRAIFLDLERYSEPKSPKVI
jgi:hypothetical protein